jgi:peptidoglycan hydrolase CwlO-like protein
LVAEWEEAYQTRRDLLTLNIGKASAFTTATSDAKWDKYILENIRDLLDLIDILWRKIDDLFKEKDEINKRLEKRDNDVTDVLARIQDWTKKYQPLLDKLDEEYNILGKVEKK